MLDCIVRKIEKKQTIIKFVNLCVSVVSRIEMVKTHQQTSFAAILLQNSDRIVICSH